MTCVPHPRCLGNPCLWLLCLYLIKLGSFLQFSAHVNLILTPAGRTLTGRQISSFLTGGGLTERTREMSSALLWVVFIHLLKTSKLS